MFLVLASLRAAQLVPIASGSFSGVQDREMPPTLGLWAAVRRVDVASIFFADIETLGDKSMLTIMPSADSMLAVATARAEVAVARPHWRALVSAAGLAVSASIAAAQPCTPEWLTAPGQGMNGVHGAATEALTWDPDGPGPAAAQLIIGGMFDVVDLIPANNVAAWDGTSWSDLQGGMTGGQLFNRVSALGTYNGELIVGGLFGQAGRVPANNIAAWDGTTWKSLGTGTGSNIGDADVNCMAEFQGKLYVGGNFQFAGDVPVNFIGAWDGASWSALGIGTSFSVAAIEQFQNELYVGGFFNDAGLVPNTRFIAKWDGTQWKSLGNVALTSSFVVALREFNSELYVGGSFTTAGDLTAVGLAKWTGRQWKQANSGPNSTMNGSVFELAKIEGNLYAGGSFSGAAGVAAQSIARFNGFGWSALGQGVNGGPEGITKFNERIVVIGGINQAGGASGVSVDRLAAWDGSAWSRVATAGSDFRPGSYAEFGGELVAVAVQGNPIGIEQHKNRVVRRVGNDWEPIGGFFNALAWTLHAHPTGTGTELIAGGWFDDIDGVPAKSVARWDGSAWHPMGNGLAVGTSFADTPSVLALETYNGELYAGGDFLQSGLASTPLIARWDGSAWQSVGGGLVGNGGFAFTQVNDLIVYQNRLIAAGDFTTAGGAGGVPASRIAAWDGSAWSALGAGIGGGFNGQFFPEVASLAVHEGSLYVAGAFELAGGQAIQHVARWDGSDWHAVASPLNAPVKVIAVHDGSIHIGGMFTEVGPTALGHIARLDPALGWQPLGTGTDVFVNQLHSYQGQLFASGAFALTGGKASVSWGRWGCPATSCYADCDASGSLTIDDFICFQTFFAIGDPAADCDGSGTLNIDDFICFQTFFALGC